MQTSFSSIKFNFFIVRTGTIFTIVTIGLFCLYSPSCAQDLVDYVRPLIGTAPATTQSAQNKNTEQLGNTIPAVGTPFAMTQWTPQTRPTEKKCRAPYYFTDQYFSGFRGTHWLSGSCTQDYGSVTIMPISGSLRTNIEDYKCRFSHKQEKTSPYHYRVNLSRYNMQAEVTATSRCGIMKFTFHKKDSAYVLAIPNSDRNEAFVKIDRPHNEIIGYNPAYRIYQGWGKPAGFNGYFVIKFNRPFLNGGTFSGSKVLGTDSIRNKENEGAYIGFSIPKDSTLLVKIGTSFSSIEGARKNLEAEIPGWNFDSVKRNAKETWEKCLEKIRIKGGTRKDKNIFYTALYHTMQQPRLFNDADGTYPRFSHQYQLDKLKEGNYYDDFSMWDVYRGLVPLYEILNPSLINSWVKSMMLKGQQGGWLPIFPCWNNYTSEMIGDHVTGFIASAYLKGMNDYDINEAYRLMRKNAFDSPPEDEFIKGKGRRAISSYLKYSFIPMEDSVPHAFHKKEQVSRTLEYAYDDYCLALVAQQLNKKEDYKVLMKRALNYKNVFDKTVGLVNGKYRDGSWHRPYYPDKRMKFVTESTPRQYTFYVPQDIPGLASLMGGRDSLELALDSLFMKNNYNHGNEPDQQAPFLYNYTSHPWKSQSLVRKILQNEYADAPGGLSGNDDAGEISAWYVFASVGLYPVNPVSGLFLISTPLFDTVTIETSNNQPFKIIVHKKSASSIYIHKTKWNGNLYKKNYLRYNMIMQGGVLEVFLGDQPTAWGSKIGNQPTGL